MTIAGYLNMIVHQVRIDPRFKWCSFMQEDIRDLVGETTLEIS